MSVRLDKWLQVARVFKTRTLAQRACTGGRVKLNGSTAKGHRPVSIEDKLEVRLGDWTRVLVIKKIEPRPVPKAMARELYLDLSPPKPTLDPIDRIMRQSPAYRERGKGRPTKKERREVERLNRKSN